MLWPAEAVILATGRMSLKNGSLWFFKQKIEPWIAFIQGMQCDCHPMGLCLLLLKSIAKVLLILIGVGLGPLD